MVVQPFKITRSTKSTRFDAIFVSEVRNIPITDAERFNTFVEIDPWDKLIDCGCDCKGFMYGKGKLLCKHISSKVDKTGLLQIIKEWGEINEVPTL